MNSAIAEVKDSSDYHKLGPAGILVGFRTENICQLLDFSSFTLSTVADDELDNVLEKVDVLISMSSRQWGYYLRRRVSGKAHSILIFDLRNNVLQFATLLDRLKFLRVHRSVQAFVDVGARFYK